METKKYKYNKTYRDPISGRRVAVGWTTDGYRYEMVDYGEKTHVALMMTAGNWSQFMEPATLDEMVERLVAKW